MENYKYKIDGVGDPIKLPSTKIAAPSHQGFTGGWFFEFITVELKSQLQQTPYKEKVRLSQGDACIGYDQTDNVDRAPPDTLPWGRERGQRYH